MHTVAPESVGLSSARLQRIEAGMQRYIDRGQLAGLITVLMRRGQVAHRLRVLIKEYSERRYDFPQAERRRLNC